MRARAGPSGTSFDPRSGHHADDSAASASRSSLLETEVALVNLGASSDHALGLIERIVREAAYPVIALIHAPDPDFVKEASKRGVFAHISDADVDWQSSIDIVLRRFAEFTTSKAHSDAARPSSAPRAS